MTPARFEEIGEALVVVPLVRRLDARVAPAFRRAVGERARGRDLVIVALRHVESVDSSGLAALVSILKDLSPRGELRLSGASGAVRARLAATGLDALFPDHDPSAAALSG
jgi:anti-sigma B factor antagonist